MYLGDTFIYKDPVVSYCLLLALGEFTHERVARCSAHVRRRYQM